MEKCKLCGRATDASFGMHCIRCDSIAGDAMLDVKAGFEQ